MSTDRNTRDEESTPVARPQPPIWALALLLLFLEFALYAAWIVPTLFRAGSYAIAAAAFIAFPLALRCVIVLASCILSRWKGMALTGAQRLRPMSWLKFFLAEYWHLCVQNLLLIPFRAFFHTHSERGLGPQTGRVLLLQHGYVNNGGVWFFTARALEGLGFRVFTIDQPAFASIDSMGELLAARVNAILAQTGEQQLTLVAHSMGGLICRAYMRRYGGAKVARLVTLGTPHHGTFHAYLARGPNGLQMRAGNAWLTELGTTLVEIPFTSIYSVHDTVISPQSSSVMPGADNVELVAIGHVSMPSGRVARQSLLRALQR